MKKFSELKKPTKGRPPIRVEKPKYDFRKPPTPIPKDCNPYDNISRIFPSYVAQNYELFELLTIPKQKVTDWDGYIKRIKQKINSLKAKFLI